MDSSLKGWQKGNEVVLENLWPWKHDGELENRTETAWRTSSPALLIYLFFFLFLFFILSVLSFLLLVVTSHMEIQYIKLKNGTALGNWGRELLVSFSELPPYLTPVRPLLRSLGFTEAVEASTGTPHPHFTVGVLRPTEVMGFIKSQTRTQQ